MGKPLHRHKVNKKLSRSSKNLCRCGSGKLFSECCGAARKPRNHIITMDFGEPVTLNGLFFHPSRGILKLMHHGIPKTPVAATREASYNRAKGPKVITRAPIPPNNLFTDVNRALRQFERVFAIDTSWRDTNGQRIAVACLVIAEHTLIRIPGKMAMRYHPIHCLEFRNPISSPENIAWMVLLELMQQNPRYQYVRKIAIVVDSDLNKLHKYNERSIPIFENFYLPDKVSLVYASADVGAENLPNMMIRRADSEARKLLKFIIETGSSDNLNEAIGQPFSHFRKWDIRENAV